MTRIASIQSISNAADTLTDFNLSRDVGAVFEFGPRNLIYGYNGAGKTTISRILAFLGAGEAPQGLGEHFDFVIKLDDGSTLRRTSDRSALDGRVLVYNEDFIARNFNWEQGSASPILGLGEAQIEAKKDLDRTREAIATAEAAAKQADRHKKQAEKLYNEHCARAAERIKEDARRTSPAYTARSLRSDYESDSFDPMRHLSEQELENSKRLLSQPNPPEKVSASIDVPTSLGSEFLERIIAVLAKAADQIRLEEIEAHPSMKEWIETGFEFHRRLGLTSCLFCTAPLTPDRLSQLTRHFSDAVNAISGEASSLKRELASHASALDTMRKNLPAIAATAEGQRMYYRDLHERIGRLLNDGTSFIDAITEWLDHKLSSPATAYVPEDREETAAAIDAWLSSLSETAAAMEDILRAHNRLADDFDVEKKRSSDQVRQHILASEYPTYIQMKSASEQATSAAEQATSQLTALRQKEVEILGSLQEHASAAEHVNREAASFLRHNGIEMRVTDEGYRLYRAGGSPVIKLSEGEKTAITFCYFITQLTAENRQLKDLIVVVDDPISSLDTRAMSYMASLIRERLAKVAQLFILTHNMPFMTGMKKWICPARLVSEASAAKKQDAMIPLHVYQLNLRHSSATGERRATLENMSALMRDYEGEYHYLFSVVHAYASQPQPLEEPFLILPNAIRKVLETFVAFRAPNAQNLNTALDAMKKGVENAPTIDALQRFTSLESHGDDLASLTELAVATIEEAHPAAMELMDFIKAVDPVHYKAMGKISRSHAPA